MKKGTLYFLLALVVMASMMSCESKKLGANGQLADQKYVGDIANYHVYSAITPDGYHLFLAVRDDDTTATVHSFYPSDDGNGGTVPAGEANTTAVGPTKVTKVPIKEYELRQENEKLVTENIRLQRLMQSMIDCENHLNPQKKGSDDSLLSIPMIP